MEKHLIEQAAKDYSENNIGGSKKDPTLCKMAKIDFEAGANWALSLPTKDINILREELYQLLKSDYKPTETESFEEQIFNVFLPHLQREVNTELPTDEQIEIEAKELFPKHISSMNEQLIDDLYFLRRAMYIQGAKAMRSKI